MKREFLQLAQQPKYSLPKIGSEKLDGERCFWDGGISRGIPAKDVPWANTSKDKRFNREQVATGLWTRYGNPIFAPEHWLDTLPSTPLDGELYAGRNNRQRLISIVRKQVPNIWEWLEVKYFVFDVPPLDTVFAHGIVDTPHYFKVFTKATLEWVHVREKVSIDPEMLFLDRIELAEESENVRVLDQEVYDSDNIIRNELGALTDAGAEGMILRNNSVYQCCRTHDMVKLKKLDDAEGTVIGYTTGRETEKGSKLLGLMGALRIRMDNDVELDISGFTESERQLCPEGTQWALSNPDSVLPEIYTSTEFARGSRVTFRYRGLSRDGVPQEARFWRKDDRA